MTLWLLWGGLGLVALYGAGVLALYLLQRLFIYLPPPGPLGTPASAGAPSLAEVTLHTSDGLDLVAWYAAPARPTAPTIVWFHGQQNSLRQLARRAERVAAVGYGVLLVEYRGFKGNPGAPTEAGISRDADAAIAFLAGQGIGPGQIVAAGFSLGTGPAASLAGRHGTAGLILEAPYTSMGDAAQHRVPLLPAEPLTLDRYDNRAALAAYHGPVLILHGARDRSIPVRMGRELASLAGARARLVTYPDGVHTDLWERGGEGETLRFLAEREASAVDTPHGAGQLDDRRSVPATTPNEPHQERPRP